MTLERPGFCAKGHKIRGANAVPTIRAGKYQYNRCKVCRNTNGARYMRERRYRKRKERMIETALKTLRFFLRSKEDFPADAAARVYDLAYELVQKVNSQKGTKK